MNISLSTDSIKYWITDDTYFSIKKINKFINYFFPDNINVSFDQSNYKYYILGVNDSNINYDNNKIYILICVENCYAHSYYNHYNKYDNYGNKNIKIYLYNHIDKIVQTNEYIAIPIIYNQIDYFIKYYNDIKPSNLIPFNEKKFCLFVSNNNHRKDIKDKIKKLLLEIGTCDYLEIYKPILHNKSCYHSIELMNIFNKYKFIFVCENSLSDGYITEKIFNCFFSRTIPIYNGCNKINNYFNEYCFINVNNIDSLENQRNKIIQLNNNEEFYNAVINCNKINKLYDNENYKEKFKSFIDKLNHNDNKLNHKDNKLNISQ